MINTNEGVNRMGMTPIHRIPMEGIAMGLSDLVSNEIASLGTKTPMQILEVFAAEYRENASNEHIGVMLDWAMQARMETGFDWAMCIRYAQVAFYG